MVRIETAGELTQAHVTNTMALRRSNMKLRTICLAAGRDPEICQSTHEAKR